MNGIHLNGMQRVKGPEQASRSGALGWAVPSMMSSATAPQNSHTSSSWFEIHKAGEIAPSKPLMLSHLALSTMGCLTAVPVQTGLPPRCQKCSETTTRWSAALLSVQCQGWGATTGDTVGPWLQQASSSAFTPQPGQSKCSQLVAIYRACTAPLLWCRCPQFRAHTSTSWKQGENISQVCSAALPQSLIFLIGCCYKRPSKYLISFT